MEPVQTKIQQPAVVNKDTHTDRNTVDESLSALTQNNLIVHATRIVVKLFLIGLFYYTATPYALELSIYVIASEVLDQLALQISRRIPSVKSYSELLYVVNSVLLISISMYLTGWIFTDYYLVYLIHISSATLAYGVRIGTVSAILAMEAYAFLLYTSHSPDIYYLRLPLLGIIILRILFAQHRFEKVNNIVNNVMNIEKTKQDFIAIASHNLRTPVAAIYGYIEILLRGDIGSINEKQRTYIQRLKENNRRLDQLTEQLLQISILEVGTEVNIMKQTTQIEIILGDLVEEFTPLAEAKKLELRYQKPIRLLPVIEVDVEKVKSVLMNLMDNAIKYTEKGSVTVSVAQKENVIVISIADTGVGIWKEEIPKIFSKFYRSGNILVYNKIGIGLGLYLGKKIIEQHGGKIAVTSEVNQGTTFTVELPIVTEKII